MREYSRNKYGRDVDQIILSIGSGLNWSRKRFLELIQRIVTNQLVGATIIVTCPDRVCRFGRELVEYLCRLGSVTLDYISEDEEKTDQQSLVDDITSLMVFFGAKVSGKKAGDILRIEMTPEHLQVALNLRQKKHYTYQQISDHLKANGMISIKGKPYSPNIVRKCLVQMATKGD